MKIAVGVGKEIIKDISQDLESDSAGIPSSVGELVEAMMGQCKEKGKRKDTQEFGRG
jgi:hypothetical protein